MNVHPSECSLDRHTSRTSPISLGVRAHEFFARAMSSGGTVEASASEGDFYRWCQYLASDRITKF
jgi:hypothetical protein